MEQGRKSDRNDEVYSKAVRAGKRTYFFDIKSTKGNDLYITVTESKKSSRDGRVQFEKHKIFLYKEDFEKFKEGLEHALEKIEELRETMPTADEFTEVSFDELN
jgi:5-bromo-4-chloroindolyl phosphate hydrolysis protein